MELFTPNAASCRIISGLHEGLAQQVVAVQASLRDFAPRIKAFTQGTEGKASLLDSLSGYSLNVVKYHRALINAWKIHGADSSQAIRADELLLDAVGSLERRAGNARYDTDYRWMPGRMEFVAEAFTAQAVALEASAKAIVARVNMHRKCWLEARGIDVIPLTKRYRGVVESHQRMHKKVQGALHTYWGIVVGRDGTRAMLGSHVVEQSMKMATIAKGTLIDFNICEPKTYLGEKLPSVTDFIVIRPAG